MDFARRRRLGYETALNSEDIDIDESLIFSEEMTEEYGYETTRTLLDRSEAPTAVVASSMIIALGVRRAIEERGLVMGKDLSIVTHDDMLSYLQNGGDVPIFTATRSSVREAGRKAAEMLLQKISDPTMPQQNVLLEAELTVGRSTGPAPN